MLFRKTGFPEENGLVLCTVTAIQANCVFVNIDEYGKQGMIHISEISPGRIRNIKDFVKEGRKIVCKVLRINMERGHIDLSLRRVNDSQKRQKQDELKLEQKSEKILEIIAKNFKIDVKQLYADIMSQISKDYEGLYPFFEDISLRDIGADKLNIDSKIKKELIETVKQRIKPVEIEVKGQIALKSYASNGIEIIKESLKQAKSAGGREFSVRYKGGGQYSATVKSVDYKQAEKILAKASEAAIDFIEKNKGEGSFKRLNQ